MIHDGNDIKYPLVQVQILPNSAVVINTVLGSNVSFATVLDEHTMKDLCKQWLENKKKQQDNLLMAQRVRNGAKI
jgi:hypothetical protein